MYLGDIHTPELGGQVPSGAGEEQLRVDANLQQLYKGWPV